MGVDLDQSLYALDSTTIDLCLSLFPWAKFRQHKAAVKMHTLLDLHGNIPTFIRVTDGDVHDVNILDELVPEAGAFYVMDRGYIDFERLYVFTLSLRVLRRAHQIQCLAPAPLFTSGRQDHRRALRSDGDPVFVPVGLCLSRAVAQNQLRRCRNQRAAGIPNQ